MTLAFVSGCASNQLTAPLATRSASSTVTLPIPSAPPMAPYVLPSPPSEKPTMPPAASFELPAIPSPRSQAASVVRTTLGLVSSFFTGEIALTNGVYYLTLPNGNIFGYYAFIPNFPQFMYHFDMGYEYIVDANDGQNGVFMYDFASGDWWYTSPHFPFPYIYDFTLKAVIYYYPDATSAGHYTTNPRYFYNYGTKSIITLPETSNGATPSPSPSPSPSTSSIPTASPSPNANATPSVPSPSPSPSPSAAPSIASTPVASATSTPSPTQPYYFLYAQTQPIPTFLGIWYENDYSFSCSGTNSIGLRTGTYGNQYSPNSIWDQYGTYGSAFSSYSPYDQYSSTPPYFTLNTTSEIVAFLTKNSFVSVGTATRIDPDSLEANLETQCGGGAYRQ